MSTEVFAPSSFARSLGGRRVVVVGLGRSGVAAASLLRAHGAEVVGTDAASREKLSDAARALEGSGVELAVGGHGAAGLERAELVVVSPGVPRFAALDQAEAAGVEVIGEIELFHRFVPGVPSVAITGSNGKSTTTTLVGELLEAMGARPFVGGNLGVPPCEAVPRPGGVARFEHEVVVLEISSFQAERVPTYRPRRAALLNLSPNHLDRYDSYEGYVAAKGNLFVQQEPSDAAVIPAGDAACEVQARRGRGTILRFGLASGPPADFVVERDAIVDVARGLRFDRGAMRLAGDHNALNVAASLALLADREPEPALVREVLASFAGLAHRIAKVTVVEGVVFYDDSKGTNVGASVAAIRGLAENRVVLVAGGRDKLGSYDPLVEALRDRGRGAVLIGEAADRLAEAIGTTVPLRRAGSMAEAVEASFELAEPGDAVLLSPACSSFDMFRDYHHRGQAFVEAVESLAARRRS